MGRLRRADEANGIYHALNRGNARWTIFHMEEDDEAFERIVAEGLERYACEVLPYQLMPNHWHFVLRPTEDDGMSNLLPWVSLTHTMRLHSHYHTAGEGHIYQDRSKSFPIQDDNHFLTVCRYVERTACGFGNESGRLAIGLTIALAEQTRTRTETSFEVAGCSNSQLETASQHRAV